MVGSLQFGMASLQSPTLFLAISSFFILTSLKTVVVHSQEPAAPSAACLQVQEECHKDTDCLHRAIYLHSTCITGTCQPQCKTAVLNLYQTAAGRNLLESDLTCLASVQRDMEKCSLIPTKTPMHCTLARFVCQANETCRNKLDIYEASCSTKGECSGECAGLLAGVVGGGAGRGLESCSCWSHDPLCAHFRESLLNPCKRQSKNTDTNKTGNKGPFSPNSGTEEETNEPPIPESGSPEDSHPEPESGHGDHSHHEHSHEDHHENSASALLILFPMKFVVFILMFVRRV